MHIGIDGRFVQGQNTGVTNYLINLLRAASRLDNKNTYSIFLSDPNYKDRIPNVSNFNIRVNEVNMFIWKNVWLPNEIRKLKIGVVHFPAYTGSFTNIGNNVVTIHDVIHKVNPDWFSPKELFLLDFPIRTAIKKSTKIIAVSQSTKKDIVKYYNIPEEKISVTLEAADSTFRPINDLSLLKSIRDKYALEGDFILCVGVLFKRRNIPRLLEAFSLLKKNKNVMHKLVIAGPGRKYFDLNEVIDKFGLRNEVIYLGYVEQKDMPLLYNLCSFFIYPSLYEGFGLPVLEAMACGKAVITSNVSSLPEIVDNVGLLVNPYNAEELYQAMARLIEDASLREDFGKRGLERSKVFSWDKLAKETIDIYEKTAHNS